MSILLFIIFVCFIVALIALTENTQSEEVNIGLEDTVFVPDISNDKSFWCWKPARVIAESTERGFREYKIKYKFGSQREHWVPKELIFTDESEVWDK